MIIFVGCAVPQKLQKMTRLILSLLFFPLLTFAQYDHVSSGRAIKFDGIDDYVDLGNIYDDVDLPVTVAAWVYFEPGTTGDHPIFISQDNTFEYTGFTVVVSPTSLINFTIGDGKGGNHPMYRRTRIGNFNTTGRWVYVAAVAYSSNDMRIYLNGYDVSGDYQGTSPFPMQSDSPLDVAKIGTFFRNSNYYWFKGVMDELRIWNRALTVGEIRETMCRKLQGNESGLIGYWNFDEIDGDQVRDSSPNGFHGEIKGNPIRVFSGAPLGDESVSLYSSNWPGNSLTLDGLTVSNISGDVYGLHIYRVLDMPSRTGGLPIADIQIPYYGIFLADGSPGNTFDYTIDYCTYERSDNSVPDWTSSESSTGVAGRTELVAIGLLSTSFDVDLGEDLLLCDVSTVTLKAEGPPNLSYQWSTGETTPEISVSNSGTFWVEVSGQCGVAKDSVEVVLEKTPPVFSLGEDGVLCKMEPRILSPGLERDDDLTFTWQDGSSEKFFLANDFGTYWLQTTNRCGISADTIMISKAPMQKGMIYNFISPDNADVLNQYLTVDSEILGGHLNIFNRWGKKVFESQNYQNDWSGGDLTGGVYFFTFRGDCIEPQKGALFIAR